MGLLIPSFVVDLSAVKKDVDANEPGTLQYHPAQSANDENLFYVWEEVRDVITTSFSLSHCMCESASVADCWDGLGSSSIRIRKRSPVSPTAF